MRVWSGSAWIATYLPAAGYLALSGGTMTGAITFAGGQTFPGTGDVTLNGTQTLTNKTINGSSNTITNVSLTAGVTGTLPIANGGTGQTTASAALNALGGASTGKAIAMAIVFGS
jgi:hypothetical protein